MKKQVLLFMAGGVLAFASCNQATEGGMSDAQVDSMVNARVEEIRAEMTAQNDSLINVMAQERADSIIAAMKGGTPAKRSTVKKPAVSGNTGTSTGATTKPETIGNGKPKIGDQKDPNTIGNNKPKIGDKKDENTIGSGKPKIGK